MTTPPASNAGDSPPPPESPRRTVMLSELAAELRAARAESRRDIAQLRARFEPELARLGELLADQADVLAQLAPRIGSLDSELANLAERLDALAEGRGGAATSTAWPSLPSAAAQKEWVALATWLADDLGPFYGITRRQVPDCWALHPRVVAELVWLRRCYVAAHTPTAHATLSADWHTRLLRDALTNINEAMPGRVCGPGRHQTPDEHQQERYAPSPSPQQVWQSSWETGPPEPRYGRPPHDEHPPAYDATAVGASSQIISREHWDRFYTQAVREDLDRRLRREKTTAAAAAAAAGQVLSPPARRPPHR